MSDGNATPSLDPLAAHAPKGLAVSWIDFLFCVLILAGGFAFLRDAPYWGHNTYVGKVQVGDAAFWWNGALHFSQGNVAENPNLTYRMGYAAFGGVLVAVTGPEYPRFHRVLRVLFLVTACVLYFSLRGLAGRIAAAAAVLCLVFNPYTAEWLAISTSDGLGLIFDLAALLALIAGVRGELRLGWIALFGFLLACGSLTRPLMTPFIVPAAIAVVSAAWGRWRSAVLALAALSGSFVAPLVAWMGFMAATTGNFALTGESQDASVFYAASDPQIQVWRGDMYALVQETAKKQFHTDTPAPSQINAEFWTLTRENYQRHWRYHLVRLWRNSFELARFTPERSTNATPLSNQARTWAKWILTITLVLAALWSRRWIGAIATAALGGAWAVWPQCHPWLALGASTLGIAALFFENRAAFLWAAYWWVGVLALYLTGGTWGPPKWGPVQDLNALGYRLGFQLFFVTDLLVICALGCLARWSFRPAAAVGKPAWLTRSSPWAARLVRIGMTAFLALLGLTLCAGAGIVAWRARARAHQPPAAYLDLTTPAASSLFRNEN
jgi:hypothetical protein